MREKVCLITGATDGIGKASALGLADAGAELFLVCRNPDKGKRTTEEIAARTGNDRVELLIGDLSSQEEVRRIADEFLERDKPLHVLLNNAGVVNLKRETTADGIETMFAVNHLAYFLLTNLLLERLIDSAPARIVNVASEAHAFVKGINFEDLNFDEGFKSMRVYGHSKLANILFTRELAHRLAGTGVTANALHPGAVGTSLGSQNGLLGAIVKPLMKLFLKSPERGAATSIYACVSPDLEGVSGRYLANCREQQPRRWATDDDVAKRLWQVSENLVERCR